MTKCIYIMYAYTYKIAICVNVVNIRTNDFANKK